MEARGRRQGRPPNTLALQRVCWYNIDLSWVEVELVIIFFSGFEMIQNKNSLRFKNTSDPTSTDQ